MEFSALVLDNRSRELQSLIKELPSLLDRAETLSLTDAEHESNKLFASAQELIRIAAFLTSTAARNSRCYCSQLLPSQDTGDSQSFHSTQMQEMSARPLESPYSHHVFAKYMTEDTTRNYPQYHGSRPRTPPEHIPFVTDMAETCRDLQDKVTRWTTNGFCPKLADKLFDRTDPNIRAENQQKFLRELTNMASLSLTLVLCIQSSVYIERSQNDLQIVQRIKSSLQELEIVDKLIDYISLIDELEIKVEKCD
ncbi:hypothetical protein F5887DRAFT_1193308 [Amanita rubescens]|nr:hypothetical protein F5887DRAFT_1193308 [Amanita rubescens]